MYFARLTPVALISSLAAQPLPTQAEPAPVEVESRGTKLLSAPRSDSMSDESSDLGSNTLLGPRTDGWPRQRLPRAKVPASDEDGKDFSLIAQAMHTHAPVYRFEQGKPKVVGRVRYASELPATEAVEGPACEGGRWHEVPHLVYVCTADGFRVAKQPAALKERVAAPEEDAIEPFLYGKVEDERPRYYRVPTVEEEERALALGAEAAGLDFVHKVLDGIYFIGIVDEVESEDRRFLRTSRGRWVNAAHVKVLEPTGMHGELLGEDRALPLAFVWGGSTTLFHVEDGTPRPFGVAEKHVRFQIRGSLEHQGERYVVGPAGLAIRRSSARVAELYAPPSRVPKGGKWLHINLAEQTLVAYEGRRPVLATLVSSGIPERRTPDGTFDLDRRYITKTMSGPDDEEGWYEVAEVPWAMYYYGNYAIHGAYWHDVFGQTRSHGCTNVPPADARWIFAWLEPELPEGWHATLWQEQGFAHFTEEPVRVELINPPTAMR